MRKIQAGAVITRFRMSREAISLLIGSIKKDIDVIRKMVSLTKTTTRDLLRMISETDKTVLMAHKEKRRKESIFTPQSQIPSSSWT